ncbi:MAG: UvrD-helicase domain-containing protein [Chloroflexi bacterium]|nr:UvrD-helicase domain-containing protein [Chloroflexota bacterium]
MTTEIARQLLADLNDDQRQAVEFIDGPLLIVAGPGSGKTRVITYRIAYLIRVLGVPPHRVLAVTFTNKAAKEMRSRLHALLGERVNEMTLGTFHNFGARLLRAHGESIGIPRDFVIYDQDDQREVIKKAIQDVGFDPKKYPPPVVHGAISGAKNQLMTIRDHALQRASLFDEVVNRVYDRYDALLRESHAVDFDDLLLLPVLLFQRHEDILRRYQERYLHTMVDEWQDTNRAQYMLTRQLGGLHHNVCVVGDPDQSIYSWRFADVQNVFDFERDFTGARTIILGRNYRSSQTILDAAHKVISGNRQRKDVRLWTDKGPGHALVLSEAHNEQEEALFVAAEIERLVREEGGHYADSAVMYRTNAQSRAPEEAFVRAGIPYRIIGGLRFWERREVKDVISYLRVVHNPHDNVSLLRIINAPTRGIGQRTVDGLSQWASASNVPLYATIQLAVTPDGGLEEVSEGMPTSPRPLGMSRPSVPRQTLPSLRAFIDTMSTLIEFSKVMDVVTLFDQIVAKTGYRDHILAGEDGEDRWDNVLELRSVASEYQDLGPGDSFSAFLETAALSSDLDRMAEEGPDAVTLITLHQAKGLEFPNVFMIGMEEGILPHQRSMDDPAQLEEERRICYVGMTRAKERLFLTMASHRASSGGPRAFSRPMGGVPSRFLADIPRELTVLPAATTSPPRQAPISGFRQRENHASHAAGAGIERIAPFRTGDHVAHRTFGEGVVVACLATPTSDDFEITVAFTGKGVKRLLANYAMLEKLV